MVVQPSMGQHFLPQFSVTQDFRPESDRERKALGALEADRVQVGLYVFGKAILDSTPEGLNYRALKGPAAITSGAPRPAWYPTGPNPSAQSDALPDWKPSTRSPGMRWKASPTAGEVLRRPSAPGTLPPDRLSRLSSVVSRATWGRR